MPSYGNFLLDKGYDADAAITKYRAVKAGAAAESVTPVTVAGENGIGVAQFDVSASEITKGKGASVRNLGITEWEAGGVIARGAAVTVDTSGRCVAAVATNRVWGVAEQAASGAGVRIAVTLAPYKSILA